MKIRTLSILFLLYSWTSIAFGQEERKYEFDGKVHVSHKLWSEVEVTIYEEDKEIKQFTTSRSGKFVFQGSSEKRYTMKFQQEGYETKHLVINTKNTSGIKKKIAAYRFKVTLEEKLSTEKSDDSYTLAGVIKINAAKNKFTHSKSINRSRKHKESYNYLSNNE